MSFHCYYRVDFTDTIHEFRDDYNYDIWDDVERESLFVMLANDHYGKDHRTWDLKPYHEICVCEKDGTPIRAMQCEMYLEPVFEAYERETGE